MNFFYIPIGLLIGLVVAAPVGPVNLICINRSFRHGPWRGFAVGIAAALGDGLFALVAALGFSQLADIVAVQRDVFRLTGGTITLAFAWFVWRSAPHLDTARPEVGGPWRQGLAVFTMTIVNPATLTAFLAIFAGSSFNDVGNGSASAIANAGILVAGVFTGSLLWWLSLCHGAALLKDKISDAVLVRINHVTAILLAVFGVAAVIAGLHRG
ncbi:MAG: LysE family translocator [Pseudomonadota bacterium]|jgi:threonine/homoserine/homoserine lactone efflux protein